MRNSEKYYQSNGPCFPKKYHNLMLKNSVLLAELKKTEDEYNNIVVPNEKQVSSYYKIRQQLDHLGKELLHFLQKPQYILPFLQPGRLVKVKT